MKKYFFDIFDGRELLRDDEGEPFSSFAEARDHATEVARELVTIAVGRGDHLDGRELRVRDHAGRGILALPFLEVAAGASDR